MLRSPVIALCIALACLTSQVNSKTVFRRTDKISENFKQLDLLPEEIDPNVAPPVKQELVETIDPADVAATGSVDNSVNDVVDVADEVVDEAANEVEGVLEVVTEVSVAAAAAVATTTAKPAKLKPTPEATTASANSSDDAQGLNKYCKCTDSHCDCCRTIGLPILPIRSQGCAKITYLGNEKMSVSLKYGDLTLITRTISGKRARPICVGLPGGENEFCGRIYGLSKGKEDFKACLGFELRSDEDDVEAALRVSCFKFGPGGLRVAEAEPLPSELNKDEDDDDDIFGFGGGGDDDDDDDYDADEADNEDEDEEEDEEYADAEDTGAPADADYGGFSLGGLLAELADDDEETTVGSNTNKNKPAAVTVATDSTRTVTASHKDMMQSKNIKGKGKEDVTVDAAGAAASAADAIVSAEEAAVTAVATTVAPAVSDAAATTVKSKKTKKNKKKNRETDYAFEILNGILDFFN